MFAGVRRPSPPIDGDSEADIDHEPVKVHHGSKMNNCGTTPLLDDSYGSTIPESVGQAEPVEEVEEPEEEIVPQAQQPQHALRRLDDFSPHPKR